MKIKKLIILNIIIIIILLNIAIFLNISKNKKEEIKIYYVDQNNFKLISVNAYIEKPVKTEKILNYLIKGEYKNNLENLIPENTKILGIEEDKNSIKINFSKEFETKERGFLSDKLQIMSVVNSIVDSTKFKNVKILINGEEKKFFNKTVYIGDFIKKDENLIK